MITYDSIRKITTGQGDHLLDYNYFKSYYKMVAIDLRKQQALDADPKAIQQINFYWKSMFFIIQEAKETFSDFSQGNVKEV